MGIKDLLSVILILLWRVIHLNLTYLLYLKPPKCVEMSIKFGKKYNDLYDIIAPDT